MIRNNQFIGGEEVSLINLYRRPILASLAISFKFSLEVLLESEPAIKMLEKGKVFIFQRWGISQCRKIFYSPFWWQCSGGRRSVNIPAIKSAAANLLVHSSLSIVEMQLLIVESCFLLVVCLSAAWSVGCLLA